MAKRILYVALKESLPGSHGGSVHVLEVARQLTARGHQVTAVVKRHKGQPSQENCDGFSLVRIGVPSPYLLFRALPEVERLAEQFKPDVVVERYYNFAGAGIAAATKRLIPSLLEVNAPLFDPPGTPKANLDRLLVGTMRKRALAQARAATRIVTPLAATIPAEIPRGKIREIPWGANVEMFNPAAVEPDRVKQLRARLNPAASRVVAFLGSFRPWHGVREFARAAADISQSRSDVLFLMIGSGELLREVRSFVEKNDLDQRLILTGAVLYSDVPHYLAVADVGVAPFNTRAHPALQFGFYWSPLKIFEYMAMSLPAITVDMAPLNRIVRHEREGLVYPEGDNAAFKERIMRLVDDRGLAYRLGQGGRRRVVQEYSWQKHAEKLEAIIDESIWEIRNNRTPRLTI